MSETAVLVSELRWALMAQAAELGTLAPEALNRAPNLADANSPAAIVAHSVAVVRVYVLGLGCGWLVDRDRPEEFAARYPNIAVAVAELRGVASSVSAALRDLSGPALDGMVAPPRALWGTGDLQVVSRRACIVHALRHTAVHVGELRLTASLLR